MHVFYTPGLNNDIFTLDENESKHGVRVLRLQVGDTVMLLDGNGHQFYGRIVDNNPKACRVEVFEKTLLEKPRPYSLTIAIAPTKNIDRFENFLEKATEIGIDRIVPLLTEHSERKNIKPERLEKIIVSAMKQSMQVYKPSLAPLTSFSQFIGENQEGKQKFIAHCAEGDKKPLNKVVNNGEITILIGPEGDFSGTEIQLAQANGFEAVSLHHARLRTETAGIVACTIPAVVLG